MNAGQALGVAHLLAKEQLGQLGAESIRVHQHRSLG